MGVVKGAISITDNATAVLKSIKQEQGSFRSDVAKTKKELTSTWDKQYKARLEATSAAKKMGELKKKMEPLRKKLVTAVAIKDAATAKVKNIANRVKAAGKMVAKPVVNVVVKGAQALSSIGKGIANAGKVAAIGIGAVGAAGAAALKAIFNGSEDYAKAQIEAETKLEAVLGNVGSIQARGAGAAKEAKQQLMGVASELQGVGVIGDEVTLAGMQQLATFQLSEKEIATLSTGMTDLLAQQKGLNASQEDAVGIGNMIGKVMQGQTSALSRVGITFDEAQEKALKTGDAEQRAAVLAEILQQNVGGVNKALAETDQGKIQQVENAYGDMKEEVGKLALSMKAKFSTVIMKNIPMIQKLGTTMMDTISTFVDKAMPFIDSAISQIAPVIEGLLGKVGDVAGELLPVVSNLFGGLRGSAKTVMPVLKGILNGFKPMIPQLMAFGTAVFSTIQQVSAAAMPAIASIISTVQTVIPAILPVLQTVITTIGSIISQAAPVIAGMVAGIGTVITTLAPIFQTIFSEIGAKVGEVIGFVSERMGFIQEVFQTVAPLLGDILTTAWGVISPIMDIAVSTFKLLFSVVQKVFPGIKAVIESVWGAIKPLFEAIGAGLEKLASGWDWIVGKVTGVSAKGGGESVGKNATGDNNWRGGLTWVGEEGAELVDLPRGSRILPHKESVSLAASGNMGRAYDSGGGSATSSAKGSIVMQQPTGDGSLGVLQKIEQQVGVIAAYFIGDKMTAAARSLVPKAIPANLNNEPLRTPGEFGKQSGRISDGLSKSITVTIAKLADMIVIREDADIDILSERVADKIVAVANNMI